MISRVKVKLPRAASEPAGPTKAAPEPEKLLFKRPNALLSQRGVTLVFVQPSAEPTQRFQGSGAAGAKCWRSVHIAGEFAEFEFSTDGDGGDNPDQRWGVMAVVVPESGDSDTAPADIPEARQSKAEAAHEFCKRWSEATARAEGLRETPEVERAGWDEARLRALCRQHGWDFEWMTEDGERERRARERWDITKICMAATRPSPSDPAQPDNSLPA